MKLIKILASTVALAAVINTASAQTTSIGPMVGVNMMTYGGQTDATFTPGYSAGAFLNHSINENFGINTKLLYTQAGTEFKSTKDMSRLSYIQLPVTAVYYLGDQGSAFRPKLFGGVYAGSLLDANHELNGATTSTKGNFNKFDMGGILGLGFNIRIADRTWLNVDGGYNMGFTDITTRTDTNFKNTGFNLQTGISFPIGK